MKENTYEYFIWILTQLVTENPNDADLGKKVREFVAELKQETK